MTFDLSSLDGTLWLCEPVQLRLAVARVLSCRDCPTAREVAEEHRQRLSAAKQFTSVSSRLTDKRIEDEYHADVQAAVSKPIRGVKGRVAVIPVHGPVEQRWSSRLSKAGGTSIEEISASLDAALADSGVDAILFHVDSPGGSSFGVQELSDKIFNARERKKTYAIADSMAASAGYWIASAAETLVATPGGDVGSVGVYAMHIDQSKALEAEGVKVSLVSAGKYKTEFAPFAPLSDDARANLQEQVNYTCGKFHDALKRNRDVTTDQVRNDFGQGRMVNAEQALERKMVNRIMTYEQLLSRLTGAGSEQAVGKGASVEMLRLRHAHAKRKAALPS